MSTGEDFIRDLLANADPEKLAAYVREIKAEAKAKPIKDPIRSNGPVKQYTTVIKQYECIACEHTFSATYQMEKGETVSCITEDGSVQTFTIDGRVKTITLRCYCSICTHCKTAASLWSREELERRWLALVESSSYKEKRIYHECVMRIIKL